MFPFTYTGEIKVFPDESEKFEQNFKEKLYHWFGMWDMIQHTKTDAGITFKGTPFRFAWNGFHFLNGTTGGSFYFDIQPGKQVIKVKLHFYESFIIALMFSIIPALVIHSGMPDTRIGDANETRWFAVAMIWGVFYLGNYFITVSRVKSFLKSFVKEYYLDELKVK